MPRELCEVDLLGVGQHHARQGVLETHEGDLRYLLEQFEAMTACKILIPMFWGHQMKRGGPVHSDDKATQRALWTAGWVDGLRLHPDRPGVLKVRFRPPPGMCVNEETGCLEDPVKHTQIREVSAGIGDWKDGTGRWWNDVLVHVALTPLPVWLGQTGISVYDNCEKMIALSADSEVRIKYILGVDMPAAVATKKKGPPSLLDDADPILGGEGEESPEGDDLESGAPMAPEDDLNVAPNDAAGELSDGDDNPLDAMIEGDPEEPIGGEAVEAEPAGCVDLLNQLGIPLPETTNKANLDDVLMGLCAGLLASGAKIVTGGEKELGMDKLMAGAKAEQPPLFTLSTGDPQIRDENPLVAALARRTAEDARQKRRERCDALVERGLPANIVDMVRARISTVTLSLDGTEVQAAMPDADGYIELLDEVAEYVAPLLMVTLSTEEAVMRGSPIPDKMPRREKDGMSHKQAAEEQAELQREVERIYGQGAQAPKKY